MALVVETGYGVVDADSYATVAEADAYWGARVNADWAAAVGADKEAALRMASEYLDLNHLGGKAPLVDGQGLAWPYLDEELSLSTLQLVRRATVMVAPLALTGPLVALAPAEQQVVSFTDKIGDISESKTYAQPINAPTVVNGRDLSFLDRMLAGLRGGGLVFGHRLRG